MRIRTVKPEFWTDTFMVSLPPLARLIYISLWSLADDHGYITDESERLAMEVMPKEDAQVFDDWLQLFVAAGRLEQFAAPDGSLYLRVAKWEKHQRVDKPGKSRISREGSRKFAIPFETRRMVANKYGCDPGQSVEAACFYCGAPGRVHWHNLANGRPSAWVTFPGLELDHLECEFFGGQNHSENIVLACRNCNRSKGAGHWLEALCSGVGMEVSRVFAKPREDSGTERNREQGKDQGTVGGFASSGEPQDGSPAASKALAIAEPGSGIVVPLKGGKTYEFTAAEVDRWKTTYRSQDVDDVLRRMAAWLEVHPDEQSATPKGARQRTNGWLNKNHERAVARGDTQRLNGTTAFQPRESGVAAGVRALLQGTKGDS
jgi:hypothetical protein